MRQRLAAFFANPIVHHVLLDVGSVATAVVLAASTFTVVARAPLTVGPAHFEIHLVPALGGTTMVSLPPLGRIEAKTHDGPLRVDVELEEVDVVKTQALLAEDGGALTESFVQASGQEAVKSFTSAAWRAGIEGILAAMLAGTLVALAVRRHPAVVVGAAVLSALLPTAIMGVAARSYDVAGFREPTLHGGLAYAPRLLDVFSTRVADIDRLRAQADRLARDLSAYYADERSFASGGPLEGTYRVLHVTDLHLDPVGAELGREIARSYEASLVIDTGDIPILGAELEGLAIPSLVDTSVARIYVPGNHDSPESIARIDALPGVTVLTTGTAEVAGLTIFGVPDPVSRGFGVEPDNERVESEAQAALERFEEAVASSDTTPQIVAIHNPRMELPFIGRVPLILSGHTHSARLYKSEGTVRLNSGTLGGMPYDPQKSGRRVLPYSASVLYFTPTEPRKLIAIDRIAVYPQQSTTVSRDVIDATLLP